MDNISSQIGALELDDHLESYGDGALEAMAGPMPTDIGRPGCPPIMSLYSDSVLERRPPAPAPLPIRLACQMTSMPVCPR
jgi:hypothetical protein